MRCKEKRTRQEHVATIPSGPVIEDLAPHAFFHASSLALFAPQGLHSFYTASHEHRELSNACQCGVERISIKGINHPARVLLFLHALCSVISMRRILRRSFAYMGNNAANAHGEQRDCRYSPASLAPQTAELAPFSCSPCAALALFCLFDASHELRN